MRQFLSEYEAAQIAPHSNMLFADAIRKWLVESELRVDTITLQGYQQLAKSHILPYFDELGVKLVDVAVRAS